MTEYKISYFNKDTQLLIKEKNLDKNSDNKITENDGELAELLRESGVNDAKQLKKPSWWKRKKQDFTAGGLLLGASFVAKTNADVFSPKIDLLDIKLEAIEELKIMEKNQRLDALMGIKTKLPTLDEMIEKGIKAASTMTKEKKVANIIFKTASVLTLLGATYLFVRKPQENIQNA